VNLHFKISKYKTKLSIAAVMGRRLTRWHLGFGSELWIRDSIEVGGASGALPSHIGNSLFKFIFFNFEVAGRSHEPRSEQRNALQDFGLLAWLGIGSCLGHAGDIQINVGLDLTFGDLLKVNIQQVNDGRVQSLLPLLLSTRRIHDGMEVQRCAATKHVPYLKPLVFGLELCQELFEGKVCSVDLPAVPESRFDLLCELDFQHISWLTRLHDWHSEVEEGIAMVGLLGATCQFDELQSLETSDRCRGGGHSRHNAACLELHLQPIHGLELVGCCPAVGHRMHVVDMVVAIVVFLELFCLDDGVL